MTETVCVKCLIQDDVLFLTMDKVYEGELDEYGDVVIVNDVGVGSYLFGGEYEMLEEG